MPAADSSESFCGYSSCLFRSGSESPSVKRILAEGSRIDKLYLGKYIPLRERKLLNKLIKTRTAYGNEFSGDDTTYNEYDDRKVQRDGTKRKAAKSGMVVNKGEAQRENRKRTNPLNSSRGAELTSKSTVIAKNKTKHLRGNRNVNSSPCVCPERCPELFTRPSKPHKGGKSMRKSHKRKSSLDSAKKSLEKIKQVKKNFKKKSITRATPSKSRYSKSIIPDIENLTQAEMKEWECDQPCDPEECNPEECYDLLMEKKEMMRRKKDGGIQKKHMKHKALDKPQIKGKEVKKGNKETDMQKSELSVSVGPKKKQKSNTAHKKIKTNEIFCECKKSVESMTHINDKKSKSSVGTTSTGTIQTETKRQKHIQDIAASQLSISHLPKLNKSVQDKKNKTHSKMSETKLDTQINYSLKRCFCTLKLKQKISNRKTRMPRSDIQSKVRKANTKSSGSQIQIPDPNKSAHGIVQPSSVTTKSSVTNTHKTGKDVLCVCSTNKLQMKKKSHQFSQDGSDSETQTQKEKDVRHKKYQSRVSTARSKYTITTHGLKRCFCTLRLRKSADVSKIKHGAKLNEKRSIGSESSPYNDVTNIPVASPKNKETVFINKKPKKIGVNKLNHATDKSDNTNKQQMKEHGSQGDYTTQVKSSIAHTNKKQNKPALGTALKRCFCTLKLLKSGKAVKKENTTTGTLTSHPSEIKDEKLKSVAANTKDYRHKHQIKTDECSCLEVMKLRNVASQEYDHRQKSEVASKPKRINTKTKSTTSATNMTYGNSSSGTITDTIKVKQQKLTTPSHKTKHKNTFNKSSHLSKSKPKNTKYQVKSEDCECLRVVKLRNVASRHSTIRNTRRSPNTYRTSKKDNVIQPVGCRSRQVVRIGSSFSFDIEFYKDCPLYDKQILNNTKRINGSPKYNRSKGSGSENCVTTCSHETFYTNENKLHKDMDPILKRCFCTLSLGKQKEHKIARQNIRKSHQVFTLSTISTRTKVASQNKILESCYHHKKTKRTTSRQIIKQELINSLMADYFDNISPSQETINNLYTESLLRMLEKSSAAQFISESTIPLPTVSTHSMLNIDVGHLSASNKKLNKPTINPNVMKYLDDMLTSGTQMTYISPYFKRCFYTLNTQIPQEKHRRKLKPYKCEPGICIPNECDPYECQKLILKRVGKRSSKITGTGTISSTSVTCWCDNSKKNRGQKTQSVRRKRAKSANSTLKTKNSETNMTVKPAKSAVTSQNVHQREKQQEIVHRTERNSNRQQNTRIGNLEDFSEPQPVRIPKTKREKRVAGKNIGTTEPMTDRSDQDTQSKALVDKDSNFYPRLKRCLCALILQKRILGVNVGQAASTNIKQKKRIKDVTNRSTLTTQSRQVIQSETRRNTKKYVDRTLDPHECEPNRRNPKERHKMLTTKTGGFQSSSTLTIRKVKKRQQTKQKVTNDPYQKEEKCHVYKIKRSIQMDKIKSSKSATPSKFKGLRPFIKTSFFAFMAETNSKKKARKEKDEVQVLHERGKNYNLQPGECPPGLCIPAPGSCDPYRCLELMRGRKEMRSTQIGTERPHSVSSKAEGPSRKHRSNIAAGTSGPPARQGKKYRDGGTIMGGPDQKYRDGGTIMGGPDQKYRDGGTIMGGPDQYVVEEPRFKQIGNPFRQAVRISSSFSFNIEFYKGGASNVPEELIASQPLGGGSPPPRVRHQGNVCDDRICTTDKAICQQGICLRNRGQQARMPNTGTVATGDSRLKKCFCTLKLQKLGTEMRHANVYADRKEPIYIDAMDRGVVTQNKYLEPYECEPGVCIPGECDPYECLKRIKARMRDTGTAMPCPYKCAETITPGIYKKRGTGSYGPIEYRDQASSPREGFGKRPRPPRYSQTYAEPIRMAPPRMTGRQAVRYGSSFKFDIELFKDRTTSSPTRPSPSPRPIVQRYSRGDGGYQKPRKSYVSQGLTCNDKNCANQGTQMTGAQTESRGAGGSLLKRCFCTLKLQNLYGQDRTVQYVSTPTPTNFHGFQRFNNINNYPNTQMYGNKVIQAYRVNIDNRDLFNQKQMKKLNVQKANKITKISPLDHSRFQSKVIYKKINRITPKTSGKNTKKIVPPMPKKQDSKLTKFNKFLKNLIISSMSKSLPPKLRNYSEKQTQQEYFTFKNHKNRTLDPSIAPLNTKIKSKLPNNRIRPRKPFDISNEFNTYEMRTIYPYRPKKFHKRSDQYEKNTKSAHKQDITQNFKPKTRSKMREISNPICVGEANVKSGNIDKKRKKGGFMKFIKNMFVRKSNSTCSIKSNYKEKKMNFTANTTTQKCKRKINSSQSERYPISSKLTPEAKKSKSVKMYREAKKERNRVHQHENRMFYKSGGDADLCTTKVKKYVSLSPRPYRHYRSKDLPHKISNMKNQRVSNDRFSAFADQKIVQFAMIPPKKKCIPEKCEGAGRRCICNSKNNKEEPKIVKKGENNKEEPKIVKKEEKTICKTDKPCACCKKNKKPSTDKENAGSECIKECETIKLIPPPPKNDCGPPLFEMKMESDTMAIINREHVISKISKLKKEKQMSADLLKKLHGKDCRCCICRKGQMGLGRNQMGGLPFAVTPSKGKNALPKMKFWGPKPCICGSPKCEVEYNKERLKKLEAKKKKKKKPCVCGTKVCEDESLAVAVKQKLITKKKGKDIKKQRENLKQEIRQKKLRKLKSRKEAMELADKQKRFKKFDLERHKRQILEEKEAERQAKKFKDAGGVMNCYESIIDVCKLTFKTFFTLIRCTFRTVTEPKLTWKNIKEAKDDPGTIVESLKGAWSNSGISSTAKRVGMRMRHMPVVTQVYDKLDSYEYSSMALHACDKDAQARMKAMEKFKKRSGKRNKPLDFECSLFMASQRKLPCLSVYYMCPWFYPHCMGMLHVLRHFTDACLFLLAVIVWSPCIIAMEICRTIMCCTACTG